MKSSYLNRVIPSVWFDQRVIPAYVAFASVALLLLQGIKVFKFQKIRASRTSVSEDVEISESRVPQRQRHNNHIAKIGGMTIFIFKSLRLAATLAFLVLIARTTLRDNSSFNIASVITSVSRRICRPSVTTNVTSKGVHGHLGSFQCLRINNHWTKVFAPPNSRNDHHLRGIRVSGYMAAHDVGPHPCGCSGRKDALG